MNELSDHKSIGENLAPEEEQRLVDLGALGWPPEDIARSITSSSLRRSTTTRTAALPC